MNATLTIQIGYAADDFYVAVTKEQVTEMLTRDLAGMRKIASKGPITAITTSSEVDLYLGLPELTDVEEFAEITATLRDFINYSK